MLSLLVTILIMCLVFGLIWWILSLNPLPAPFGQVARVVVAVIFVIWLIYLLLGAVGGGGFGLGHPLVH
jgi:hypothetical protein